ncbi:MAG: glycosyltransferase [Novosphingobium sp.]
MSKTIAYLVHNLDDPAVLRRVRMFYAGGANVVVLGFRRSDRVPASIAGAPVIDLGRTADGQFGQRIAAVLRHAVADGALRRAVAQADVLVARNLEMLVLAARLAKGRRLVYECLDIHRLLLVSGGVLARLVQWVERRLLTRVDLILTSSPRFETAYFRGLRRLTTPILLVENKVLALGETAMRGQAVRKDVPESGPWVIGWFGMLRCRRTLAILSELAAHSQGRIAVVIAGIPSDAEFQDLAGTVAGMPGVTFTGRYAAGDLTALYGAVHFAWAIDYFEEGLNSTWLLPNRLYESLDNGVVPIALADVETGAWLTEHGAGLVIADPCRELPTFLQQLTASDYRTLAAKVAALPARLLRTETPECVALVDAVTG